ncbi:MinD/ParA family protein [Streptomyces sp. NBC_00076]|uniref:MinD/ParA family ATP-binding protein n=1 Tax=Streptomyces sp. NBC_00076 TaxID=2975642 RepID=UPI00324C19A7
MPNGDNWQSDVLRDLRGGAAQQRIPQPPQQGGAQPEQQPQPPEQQGPQPQQQGAQPQQRGQVPADGNPQQAGPGRPEQPYAEQAYGNPQQAAPGRPEQPYAEQAYGYPQQANPAQQQPQQPQQPYGYPQQGYPAQGQQPYSQQHHGYPQQQPYGDQAAAYAQQPHQAQPQAYPQQQQPPAQPPQAQAPAPRARSARATPDSRPVVDEKLASAGRGPRRGEPFSARALRAVRRTVSSSAAREVAETTATAEVLQQPVTTGRQIAVTSIRGGSGKTTVAALLATTYAHYRQDPVLAIEADPALGSLPLRLGAQTLRWTTGDLADVVQPQMTLLEVTGYLVQLPENAWLLPGSQGQVGAMLDTKAYERVMVSMRRYFGVTVVDCETMPAEVARTALSAAQGRILTVPATLEGIASTHAVLQWMRGLPRDITTTTVVVLTETVPHTGVDLGKAAERLKETGASVRVLPYDRHLAAGGTIRTELLARDTREAATRLAAEVFQLSQKSR